ncbi:MAG: hypothetical protein IKG85_10645 [Clostridia bacterium]|nr:hypothetical protein [Clostridia bacterium]
MKVLILSNTPWDNSNSFGSTFSNFFEGMEGVELANIYCQCGEPNNKLAMRCFQIDEKSLLRNLRDKSAPSGHEVVKGGAGSGDVMTARERGRFDVIRRSRLRIFYWARELIWRIGRPAGRELKEFIDDFAPDVIFQPLYDSMYLTRLARFIMEYTGRPVVGFIGDDIYTLRQFRLSPLYWIDRLMKRPGMKRMIKSCEKVFVMTELQKREYDRIFGIDCGVLTKGAVFTGEPPVKSSPGKPVVFTYTGNIYNGRWKTLAALGKALEELSHGGQEAELRIYTRDALSKRAARAFDLPAVKNMGGVPGDMIPAIQEDADVLVFTDGCTPKSKGIVRHSFSTKLVDYMKAARCILAVGPEGIASIDHLKNQGAAVVVTDRAELLPRLRELLADPGAIRGYGLKAWECGARCHSRPIMQGRLKAALEACAEEKK